VLRVLAAALAQAGYEVKGAADGAEAWEALHRERYDLLVTDLDMPRLPGWELVERIRADGLTLPIIIASGSYADEILRDQAQLQISALLSKPFTPREFLKAVRIALRPPEATARAPGRSPSESNAGSLTLSQSI